MPELLPLHFWSLSADGAFFKLDELQGATSAQRDYRPDPDGLFAVQSLDTDEYGNNLIIARYHGAVLETNLRLDGEAEEVLWLQQPGRPGEWAFPRHHAAALSI